MADLRDYHVVLSDGTERNVRAKSVEAENEGTLVFMNGSELVLAYAPTTWRYVELELKDDSE